MTSEFDFDPFDPRCFDDPYPAYRVLRERFPVYRREIPNHRVWPHYWMLSRASDVDAALLDWRSFSSARGTLIDTDITLIPPNVFNMDPPRHDELRDVLARVLTPARVAGLEPQLRRQARELVAGFAGKGCFDAAQDYGQLIPTLTMCELMDLPVADRAKFLRWNLDTLAGADFTSEAALHAYGEMERYWVALVAERRAHRGKDLISQLLHTPVAGAPLSDAEIAGFCSLLHDASQNTTMNMIANSILVLGRHPDERRLLRAEPRRFTKALEELFRFVSPVQGLARATTRDVTLHGVTIPAGDQVLLLYGSANHDEAVWADPERFDLERDARSHWAFGNGIHYCLGNAVARLEVRVALEVLLEGIADFEVEEAAVVRNQLVPTRGVARAPIHFAPRSGGPMAHDRDYAFDPMDPASAKDPARMARIRRERPVCRPAEGVVLTTRLRDTAEVFRDAKRFSSAGDMRAPGVVVADSERFLGEIDAPVHPKIRRVMIPFFTRSASEATAPWTRASARRRLEALRAAGGGDLMKVLAIPLPGSVSAHVLGIPDALHDPLMHWCDELLHSSWPATGRTERGVGIAACFPELAATLDGLIREREDAGERAPSDLLTAMVRFRDADGWRIEPAHVRTLCVNLLAGSLSATYMLGNLFHRLLSDEGFERALREDRAKLAAAVEESLRLEAPVAFLFRTAMEDTAIGGCPVHRGEHVMLGIAAAGRDESAYERADEFRLDRVDPPEHLAFGYGPHVCVGNHLTRVIGRVALEEALAVFPAGALRLAPGFVWRCVAHPQEYGPETLDVVVARA